MSAGELEQGDASAVLVDFVCMAKHAADLADRTGHTLAAYRRLNAYCVRGAATNHEWVRVPATPLGEITTGLMEERPPEPARPRIPVAS